MQARSRRGPDTKSARRKSFEACKSANPARLAPKHCEHREEDGPAGCALDMPKEKARAHKQIGGWSPMRAACYELLPLFIRTIPRAATRSHDGEQGPAYIIEKRTWMGKKEQGRERARTWYNSSVSRVYKATRTKHPNKRIGGRQDHMSRFLSKASRFEKCTE